MQPTWVWLLATLLAVINVLNVSAATSPSCTKFAKCSGKIACQKGTYFYCALGKAKKTCRRYAAGPFNETDCTTQCIGTQTTSTYDWPAGCSAPEPVCASMGVTSTVFRHRNVSTCTQFYTNGSAIRLPNDTLTLKYGSYQWDDAGQYLRLRDGTTLRIPDLAMVPDGDRFTTIFRASVSGNTIVASVTPVLYIPLDTMLKPFRGSSFIGLLSGHIPWTTTPVNSWVRWDIGSTISNFTDNNSNMVLPFLKGSFINLLKPVKDALGKCQPALCDRPDDVFCNQSHINTTSMSLVFHPYITPFSRHGFPGLLAVHAGAHGVASTYGAIINFAISNIDLSATYKFDYSDLSPEMSATGSFTKPSSSVKRCGSAAGSVDQSSDDLSH